MFTDVSQYVKTLCDLDMTANQFLLCYLLCTDKKVNGSYVAKGQDIAELYRYASHNNRSKMWTKEEVRDLVDKGYLEDPHYNKKQTYPDHLVVTEKFHDIVWKSKGAYRQLLDLYPSFIDNFNHPGGPKIKLKVADLDKLEEIYNRKVKTKSLHQKILDAVEWAIENKQINTSFDNFIRGELWSTYFDLMKEYSGNTSNMNVAR